MTEMKNKATHLPVFADHDQAAEWFAEHDVSRLLGEEDEVPLERRRPVKSSFTVSTRLDAATVSSLRAAAQARGVGVTQLMRQWLKERLETEHTSADREQIAAELERLAKQVRAAG
ncbi:MAG: CopG family antitoxin [Mycobacteriales bacterium]